jgi:hypothetical protein
MDEQILLALLRYDLNRLGARPDDDYLKVLIRAAIRDLQRAGIVFPGPDHSGVDIEDFQVLVVGTAAWMYTKRRTGEKMPQYVRSIRNRLLLAQKAGN